MNRLGDTSRPGLMGRWPELGWWKCSRWREPQGVRVRGRPPRQGLFCLDALCHPEGLYPLLANPGELPLESPLYTVPFATLAHPWDGREQS